MCSPQYFQPPPGTVHSYHNIDSVLYAVLYLHPRILPFLSVDLTSHLTVWSPWDFHKHVWKAHVNVITAPTINHLHVFNKQAITEQPPLPPRHCSLLGFKPGRRQIQLSVMRDIVQVNVGERTALGSEQASSQGFGLSVKGRARSSWPREERGEWDSRLPASFSTTPPPTLPTERSFWHVHQPNFAVLSLLSHRELQMKERPSYEPNHGLSRMKAPCWAVLTWIRHAQTVASSLARCLLWEEGEDPELASDESLGSEHKEQADLLAIRLYQILWSLTKCFVSHVSRKYLINSCTVIFWWVGAGSSRILWPLLWL